MNKDETENITIKLSKAVMWRLFCRFLGKYSIFNEIELKIVTCSK